jgi:flagellar motor protein MotB
VPTGGGELVEQLEESISLETPVWAIFGDLMAGLVGVFVLLLVWTLGIQLELAQSLESEIEKRQAEEQRRMALEEALADPLATGRVTLHEGRIGISGSVLFSSNSDQLQTEGRELLRTLVGPLRVYLGEREQLLMVSGFTDDLPIQKGNSRYVDNWELSAERALTVTRALIEAGMPSSLVFTAAFGDQQPAVPNVNDQSRAQNRRVEMAPVPSSANHLTHHD